MSETVEREVLRDPKAWESGYERGLEAARKALGDLPMLHATKTRDEGRGFAFAIDMILSDITEREAGRLP